jgi:hypothetical protein
MHKPLFLDALYETYNQTDSYRYKHRETKYPEIPHWARKNKSNLLSSKDLSEEKSEEKSHKSKETAKDQKSNGFKKESRSESHSRGSKLRKR